MKEFETVLKVLAAKIESLEAELRLKDWQIEELNKKLEDSKHE